MVRSNADGLLMAHPRLGWLELNTEIIEKTAPNGFDVILVDRTMRRRMQSSTSLGPTCTPALPLHAAAGTWLVLRGAAVHTRKPVADPGDHRQSDRPAQSRHLQVLGIALMAVTIFEGCLAACAPSCLRTLPTALTCVLAPK